MPFVEPTRLAVVSARSSVRTGTAVVTGATSRDPGFAVELELARTSATEATLTGGVSRYDNGRTALTMKRAGRRTDIVGSIGFESTFKKVELRLEQASFERATLKGVLCGRDVDLVIERARGVTTVTGKLGAYEQSTIGSTSIVIRDDGQTRTFEGSTSRESGGAVRLVQTRDGELLKTTGKLAHWDVTELTQPATMRDLELVDTTLLIVLTQAIRRWIQQI